MRREAVRLFLLGFLTLFLELVLIRYLAANVWNLAYFPNLVLIATFIGMGIGFVFHWHWSERMSHWLFLCSIATLTVLILLVTLVHPPLPGFTGILGEVGEELYPTNVPFPHTMFMYLAAGLCFLAVVAIFFLISQRTAKLFRQFSPLHAYTLDIGGSCLGILSFMFMSWLHVPASFWFLMLIPLVLPVMSRVTVLRFLMVSILLCGSAAVALQKDTRLSFFPRGFNGDIEVVWSPYQKVEYAHGEMLERILFVNGVIWQSMDDTATLRHSLYQKIYDDRAGRPQLPPYRRVLILGAGAGNDVQAALNNEAERVDAVEIDPVILEMGRKYHPERPYDDPRVTAIVDDGRAVLARADKQYDLIVFALTESLLRVSPMAQLRLENYLFTVEAVEKASALLTEHGDLVFYNFYRRPWLTDKISRMVERATGFSPRYLEQSPQLAILAAGRHNRAEPRQRGADTVDPPTDDWPFLYIKRRGIPGLYIVAMVAMMFFVLVLLLLAQWSERVLRMDEKPHAVKFAFLFMGGAFLLLETKSVVQFSLLFGTTWFNTSFVILAVLLLVLAANWTALLLERSHMTLIAVLLLLSCMVSLLVPLWWFLQMESVLPRILLASLLLFLPVFFANLLFSVSFRRQRIAERLFGWNLFGATLGGVGEYASMWIGYRMLAVVVLLCYAAVWLLLRKARERPCVITTREPNSRRCRSG